MGTFMHLPGSWRWVLFISRVVLASFGMGRILSASRRSRIQDKMKMLRRTFRAALKENELQEAFDELWPTWGSEIAAMIYSEVVSSLDLLVLTAAVDNRREIMRMKRARGSEA